MPTVTVRTAGETATATYTVATPITNLPAQPAGIVYGTPPNLAAYATPGALVIAGRDQYNHQQFKNVSAAGGTVLVYLDVMYVNPYGRYHGLLFNSSTYGAAVPNWPGNVKIDSTYYLADFRVGGVLQSKLEAVLELMVAENPHMAGWFADDLGSRSWYPNINWSTFSATDKAAWRGGAIALCQTFRRVADRHGLMFMVNGTWTANDGGGYPTTSTHGMSLADGGFVEHHDGQISFFGPYAASAQWASQSPLTQGKAFMYAVTSTSAGLTEYRNSGKYAYVHQQSDYDTTPPPWGAFHPTGLPSHAA